jgi:hypothetical protein
MTPPNKSKHVQLVSTHPHEDVVEVLEGLTALAKQGDLTGLVFGVALKGQKYYCDSAGTLFRNPILGIGVASRVVLELNRRVQRREEETL